MEPCYVGKHHSGQEQRWPLQDPLDDVISKVQSRGRWLALDRYRVEVGTPHVCPDWEWQDRFSAELERQAGPGTASRPRFGSWPCYVPARDGADLEDCFIGELPALFLDLTDQLFYLHTENGRGFWQEMQIT